MNKRNKKIYYLVVCFMASMLVVFSQTSLANGMGSTNITIHGISHSAHKINFTDNSQEVVTLSNVGINRIAVKGDKITSINGPDGSYSAKSDATGSAYLTVYAHLPFTIFVTTKDGHNVSLFVTPRATVGTTIILIPSSPGKTAKHWEKSSNYNEMLVALIRGMALKKAPSGYNMTILPKLNKKDFYGIATITPRAVFRGGELMGVVYVIQNRTRHVIILKESYFYRKGLRAVALARQKIAPLGVTNVYEVVNREAGV